jgi:hypothetical protein
MNMGVASWTTVDFTGAFDRAREGPELLEPWVHRRELILALSTPASAPVNLRPLMTRKDSPQWHNFPIIGR